MNIVKLSKFLSLVLRHQPDAIGLELDEQGWVDVEELLARLRDAGKETTREQLERVVIENNKQRFRFSEDGERIRANQGHSVKIELGLSPVEPPDELFHGTATRFLDSILAEGLRPGSRRHVHLSQEIETATTVGRRHGKAVVLTVRSGEMHERGFSFFLSDNNVWLTDQVPSEFLAR